MSASTRAGSGWGAARPMATAAATSNLIRSPVPTEGARDEWLLRKKFVQRVSDVLHRDDLATRRRFVAGNITLRHDDPGESHLRGFAQAQRGLRGAPDLAG